MIAYTVGPDQMLHDMPHHVASDLGLHSLPMTLTGLQVRMNLRF